MQRLKNLYNQLCSESIKILAGDALKIVDNRTKKYYVVTLKESKDCYYIKTKDLSMITDRLDKPLRIYDPGYVNTICNQSKISFIDGIRGRLQYRGYKIQQLTDKSHYLQVAFLLIFGELPSQQQHDLFVHNVLSNTILHDNIHKIIKSSRYDAHPMGVLISALNALSTLQQDTNRSHGSENIQKNILSRNTHIYKLIGIIPTIVANIYRHQMGKDFIMPKQNFSYTQNLLYMLDANKNQNYTPHPKLVKALEILFIIYAEHQMNCSTSLVRHIASSGVNIYTICSVGACALYGSKHGGANSQVIAMLQSIGTKSRIRKFLMEVKMKKRKLYGFGNRIYKNFDPRAKIIQKIANDVFQVCGKEPLIQIALQLQRTALQDDFFITRKLYPNADFYSGLIYRAMGFDKKMYSLIYAIPRISGWLAHWIQFSNDRQNNIYRPRQNYVGYGKRQFIEFSERKDHNHKLQPTMDQFQKRRQTSKRYQQQNRQ